MVSRNLLFNKRGAVPPSEIRRLMSQFEYKKATRDVIRDSRFLDVDGGVFVKCAACMLSNFGMTRSGPFKGVRLSMHARPR